MTEPGTTRAELVQELYQLLGAELVRQLKGKPSADLLQVARKFLQDNGMLGLAQDEKDRAQLQRMYGLYVRQLLKAIKGERPSASIFNEARQFITSQGIGKDLGGAITQAQALAALDMSSLPFKIN